MEITFLTGKHAYTHTRRASSDVICNMCRSLNCRTIRRLRWNLVDELCNRPLPDFPRTCISGLNIFKDKLEHGGIAITTNIRTSRQTSTSFSQPHPLSPYVFETFTSSSLYHQSIPAFSYSLPSPVSFPNSLRIS